MPTPPSLKARAGRSNSCQAASAHRSKSPKATEDQVDLLARVNDSARPTRQTSPLAPADACFSASTNKRGSRETEEPSYSHTAVTPRFGPPVWRRAPFGTPHQRIAVDMHMLALTASTPLSRTPTKARVSKSSLRCTTRLGSGRARRCPVAEVRTPREPPERDASPSWGLRLVVGFNDPDDEI